MPALKSRSWSDLNLPSGIRFPSECGIDRCAGTTPPFGELLHATATDCGCPIIDSGSARDCHPPRTEELLHLEPVQQWIQEPLAQSDLPPRDRLYGLGQLITIHLPLSQKSENQ
jgi:hypothetical protein